MCIYEREREREREKARKTTLKPYSLFLRGVIHKPHQ
jgi:hypothetical protein